MDLPLRIANLLCVDDLEIRVRPERHYLGQYQIVSWSANIYNRSGRWVWTDGEGQTPDEAVQDLLERNAEDIERACQERESEGYDLKLKPAA